MGGDGGSIPTRDVLAKTKKAKKTAKQVTFGQSELLNWTHCHLTAEPLTPPIVCDNLGNLYNKMALIETMINKKMPKSLSYIERISKDTVNCNVTMIEKMDPTNGGIFECPISGLIANGKYAFVVLRKCGCFLSERALKNIQKRKECLVCGKKMDEMINDYTQIPINSDNQKKDKLFKMMLEQKKTKKHKKKKKKKDVVTKKQTLCGKKRVLDEAEESVAKKMKTSHVFKSIFDRKQRDFNFAGGGTGF